MAVESTSGWRPVGAVSPASLRSARREAHVGAWFAGAVGRALAPPEADHAHVSLEWNDSTGSLDGVVVERIRPLRASFRPARSELVLAGSDGERIGSLALEDRSAEAARTWLEAALEALAPEPGGEAVSLEPPPDGPLDLEIGAPGLEAIEISAWLGNASHLLLEIAAAAGPAASSVRCWPHHFDIATLITLDPHADGEQARSLGIGLSLGDDQIAQPYWYVNVWPAPSSPDLPELPIGAWTTDGWLGAYLTGEKVVAAGSADSQEALSRDFLAAAVQAAGLVLAG